METIKGSRAVHIVREKLSFLKEFSPKSRQCGAVLQINCRPQARKERLMQTCDQSFI